jgi:DMSO/TMAO reductase YedYZ molybdopterin-dependent catalytic subunit
LLLASLPALAAEPDTLLVVQGDVETPYALTAASFAALPHERVRATGHDAKESDFEGVLLSELLGRAGVKLGAKMRGEHIAYAVIVRASDAYRAVFALPELDPAFTDQRILLADRRDGQPIAGSEGFLRMVVPGDKRHARWVRQVISLTVKKL